MLSLADAVSRIPLVLGANSFGWTTDRVASFAVLDAFAARGGAAIDTADGYSYWAPGNVGGESERIIGEWIASRGNRDEMVVATKVSRHPQFAGLSARNVAAAARASLDRMHVDVIDLYFAHFDDPAVPLSETVAAFDLLVTEGLVREVGLSNYTTERVEAWIGVARAGGHRLPVALQPHYNLVHREPESDLLPAARAAGLAVIPYFGLASGFLTGRYRTVEAARASHRARFLEPYLTDRGFAVVDRVTDIATARGVTPAVVALAWLREQAGVLAPIASASSLDQLNEMLDGATFELGDSDHAALSAASAPEASPAE
jgi:aryl-alcohol dehydrogenase-like predicted oxidoreductase